MVAMGIFIPKTRKRKPTSISLPKIEPASSRKDFALKKVANDSYFHKILLGMFEIILRHGIRDICNLSLILS